MDNMVTKAFGYTRLVNLRGAIMWAASGGVRKRVRLEMGGSSGGLIAADGAGIGVHARVRVAMGR